MVLRLKTRESRSLPGLPSARSSHIRIRMQTNLLLAIVVMHVVASKPLTLLSDMHEARQTGSRAAQAALSLGGPLNTVSANLPLS